MTPQPTLEEIMVKAVSEYHLEVSRTGAGYDSGRPHDEIIQEAVTAIRAWAVSQLPEKKNPKNFSQVKLYTGADLADVHNGTVDQATQSLMNQKEGQNE